MDGESEGRARRVWSSSLLKNHRKLPGLGGPVRSGLAHAASSHGSRQRAARAVIARVLSFAAAVFRSTTVLVGAGAFGLWLVDDWRWILLAGGVIPLAAVSIARRTSTTKTSDTQTGPNQWTQAVVMLVLMIAASKISGMFSQPPFAGGFAMPTTDQVTERDQPRDEEGPGSEKREDGDGGGEPTRPSPPAETPSAETPTIPPGETEYELRPDVLLSLALAPIFAEDGPQIEDVGHVSLGFCPGGAVSTGRAVVKIGLVARDAFRNSYKAEVKQLVSVAAAQRVVDEIADLEESCSGIEMSRSLLQQGGEVLRIYANRQQTRIVVIYRIGNVIYALERQSDDPAIPATDPDPIGAAYQRALTILTEQEAPAQG